ncbi:MAG: hypothetical protein L3J69_05815 [Desulfobacula sp.]|nr:hypothetical protein [Desulfobacula sp.]
MIKKTLVLIVMAGIFFINHLAFAQTATTRTKKAINSNFQPAKVLKSAKARATRYDPLRYAFITGAMELDAYSTLIMSVVNSKNTGDEYVQFEVHAAVVSGASPSPKLLKRSAVIKVGPKNIVVFKHYRRKDGTDGNLHNHWVKIKVSSEYLIPKLVHHSMPDPTQHSLIRSSYMPGDFAFFSRYPFKRLR